MMILKRRKPPNEVTSHRSTSLLSAISKLSEKLLLKRLKIIIEKKRHRTKAVWIREKHSTIEQVHRLTDATESTLVEKKICATVFFDAKQAFDKVCHNGLMTKLHMLLPKLYGQILQFYISGRLFRIKQGSEYSRLKEIKAGVPQGSVLGSLLCLLYTYDVQTLK
jgi:hypothetical protein